MKKLLFSIGLYLTFASAFCNDITFVNSDNTKYTKNSIYCDGNVIIVHCGRIISADKISYNRNKQVITSTGNVIIKDEKQNTYFMDSLCVSKNFKTGNAKNIKIIMQDKSRLAATECTINAGKFELKNVIYSPCYECTELGELTWQIKSYSVIFDPEEDTTYESAEFDLFGTALLYAPYFSHASSNIKKKSGFLPPRLGLSSKSGFGVCPQYLYLISDSQELILKPIITSKIGNVGWVYYGFRFPHGEFNVDTSITDTRSIDNEVGNDDYEKKSIQKIRSSGYRGHIFSKLRYEINNTWRCSSDINLASDRYYLKKFPFMRNTDRALESNAKLEGFDGDNYTLVKTAMFQAEPSQCVPRVLPVIERNYSSDFFYGTFHLDSSFMHLDFNNHRSSQKAMSNASWNKKILLPMGNIFDIACILSVSGLRVSEKEKSTYDSSLSVIPQINCFWQWPLIISSKELDTIFTPIFGMIIASNKKHKNVFEEPFCEINDVNLFEGNRFFASYNIDSGKRMCYGAKLAGYKDGESLYRFIIGRSTELSTISDKLEATGLKHKHSNIVTSADVFLLDELTLTANGSFSTHRKKWLKIETGLCFSNGIFDFDLMF
ncbi:MAG: LPS assembly protein LptD, partial [Holosporaceae bacterium]|nr:LPS assembly protein LptD [Holosporaceae bacterium]